MLFVGLVFSSTSVADTSLKKESASPFMVPNPGSELWRAVRQRNTPGMGKTQVTGVETGVLINSGGEDFRNFRRENLIGNSAWLIGGFAVLILVFYLTKGCIRIPGGRSGRLIKRFENIDRTLHWVTAILFLIQAVTGMTLMFGRFALLPVLGADAFSTIANAGLLVHNWLGPLFLISLVFLIARFISKNAPTMTDLKWLAKGGGAIGEGHASAGFFNGGEKIWFWAVVVLGLTASVTGLILDFPILPLSREALQITLIVHAISAVFMFTGSIAHIYIGTIGSEGSLESMTTGYVDENWAEAHHDLWHAEMTSSREPVVDNSNPAQELPPMSAPPEFK